MFVIQSIYDHRVVTVERRFSHFVTLDKYLQNTLRFQGVILPRLPDKQVLQTFLNKFVSKSKLDLCQRRQELQKYLEVIQSHSVLVKDKTVIYFLTEPSMTMCGQAIDLENNVIPSFSQTSFSEMLQYAKAYFFVSYDTNKYTEVTIDSSALQT